MTLQTRIRILKAVIAVDLAAVAVALLWLAQVTP